MACINLGIALLSMVLASTGKYIIALLYTGVSVRIE